MGFYTGRVAIVTGAASGIGRALSHALCDAGAQVVMADVAVAGVGAAAGGRPAGNRACPSPNGAEASVGRCSASSRSRSTDASSSSEGREKASGGAES